MRGWLNVTVAVGGILLGRDRQRKWCVMTASCPERVCRCVHPARIASLGTLLYTFEDVHLRLRRIF
jgi:hypothetical protein